MKKLFLWILFILIVFFLSTQVSKGLHSKLLYLSDGVKIGILNLNQNITNIITRHFNQAEQIKHLTNELKNKESLQYSLNSLEHRYNALLELLQASNFESPNFHLVRTISYAHLNDYTKVWLQGDNKIISQDKEDKIFGLVINNQVAGIAIFRNNRLMGFLNGDEQCNYSVIIGENKAPGIAKYDINKGFIVDYIPPYPKIKAGDVIKTSGYDGIFYPEIPIGEVQSVEERQGYQIAIIKPFLKEISQFYWLINANQEKDIQEQTDNLLNFN
ncbi:MAG: rod shape-determining protein MreC [Helicobacter sp.]|uniref:rod shape-determining protein MreC n=1 Tax=Helicobacter sp. TaxID=218 RepID=UPI002A7EF130|nr:rod shape-determining protein MreC [Helicobacter sp.]MDY4426852.1 rod shape-determining protein MreC [Helicobacter sp.]